MSNYKTLTMPTQESLGNADAVSDGALPSIAAVTIEGSAPLQKRAAKVIPAPRRP
jgi:hypothetical protein